MISYRKIKNPHVFRRVGPGRFALASTGCQVGAVPVVGEKSLLACPLCARGGQDSGIFLPVCNLHVAISSCSSHASVQGFLHEFAQSGGKDAGFRLYKILPLSKGRGLPPFVGACCGPGAARGNFESRSALPLDSFIYGMVVTRSW